MISSYKQDMLPGALQLPSDLIGINLLHTASVLLVEVAGSEQLTRRRLFAGEQSRAADVS